MEQASERMTVWHRVNMGKQAVHVLYTDKSGLKKNKTVCGMICNEYDDENSWSSQPNHCKRCEKWLAAGARHTVCADEWCPWCVFYNSTVREVAPKGAPGIN